MKNGHISDLELTLGGAMVVGNYPHIRIVLDNLTIQEDREFAHHFLASSLPRDLRSRGILEYCLIESANAAIQRRELHRAKGQLIEARSLGANVTGHFGRLQRKQGKLELAQELFKRAIDEGFLAFQKDLIEVSKEIEHGGTRPTFRLIRESRDAEIAARDWLRYFGFSDAAITPPGPDGGIDVLSKQLVAQVKMEGRPTGAPVIQALAGIAKTKERGGAVFSLAGFTPSAVAFAQEAEVALFRFDFQGVPEAENRFARQISR